MTEADAVIPSPALLRKLLARNLAVIAGNTKDLNQEQSLIPITDKGSHFNWLLGHLISARGSMLKLLEHEPMWDDEKSKPFKRGSNAQLAPTHSLEELLSALETSQERLEQALDSVSEATLKTLRPSGSSTGEALEFLIWHESYHAGQTTHYRRLAGLTSPIG